MLCASLMKRLATSALQTHSNLAASRALHNMNAICELRNELSSVVGTVFGVSCGFSRRKRLRCSTGDFHPMLSFRPSSPNRYPEAVQSHLCRRHIPLRHVVELVECIGFRFSGAASGMRRDAKLDPQRASFSHQKTRAPRRRLYQRTAYDRHQNQCDNVHNLRKLFVSPITVSGVKMGLGRGLSVIRHSRHHCMGRNCDYYTATVDTHGHSHHCSAAWLLEP